MPDTYMAVMPTDMTVWAGHMGTRALPATLACQIAQLGAPWAERTLTQAQVASQQAIVGRRHTSVRTDEDSGFDTLWLLKKMDSRSEKADRERIRPGDCNADTRGQHHPSLALGGL